MTTPTPSKEEVAQGVSDTPGTAGACQWLIWSNEHRAWWGADRCGYRNDPAEAGRYSLDDAMSICRVRSWQNGVPPEAMVHESAVWFGRVRPSGQAKPSSPPSEPDQQDAVSVAVAEALERAAGVCEEMLGPDCPSEDAAVMATDCADAIRSLLPSVDHTRSGSGK